MNAPSETSIAQDAGADPYASDPRGRRRALRPWWRWLFLLPGLAAVAYGGHGLLTAGGGCRWTPG